jgi:hypothetical protein
MADRFTIERALRVSTLGSPGRLLALTLLTWTDHATARIPAEYTPSLNILAEATGMGRSSVAKWLTTLQDTGWVIRWRPETGEARGRLTRTRYALTIPGPTDQDAFDSPDLDDPDEQLDEDACEPEGSQGEWFGGRDEDGSPPWPTGDDHLAPPPPGGPSASDEGPSPDSTVPVRPVSVVHLVDLSRTARSTWWTQQSWLTHLVVHLVDLRQT